MRSHYGCYSFATRGETSRWEGSLQLPSTFTQSSRRESSKRTIFYSHPFCHLLPPFTVFSSFVWSSPPFYPLLLSYAIYLFPRCFHSSFYSLLLLIWYLLVLWTSTSFYCLLNLQFLLSPKSLQNFFSRSANQACTSCTFATTCAFGTSSASCTPLLNNFRFWQYSLLQYFMRYWYMSYV